MALGGREGAWAGAESYQQNMAGGVGRNRDINKSGPAQPPSEAENS